MTSASLSVCSAIYGASDRQFLSVILRDQGATRVSFWAKLLGIAVLAVAFCSLYQAHAAEPVANVPHVGYLSIGSPASNAAFLTALKDGLRELGYVEGRNIVIDERWSGRSASEFPQLAASLVAQNPAAIVGTCIPSTRAAKAATATIPVVMSVDGDPVAAGLVSSLARPGGNVTGTSTLFEELVPKWLELITIAVPKARVIAALLNPEDLTSPYFFAKLQQAGQQLGVKVVRADARLPADLDGAFASMRQQHADAFVVMAGALLAGEAQHIAALAERYKLPGIYSYREFAEAGALMSYGVSYKDYFKGVSRYVDRVLKGTKPADLPVEQATRIELVINLPAAKKLGVILPQELLLRADTVLH